MEQSGLISIVVGAGAAWFGLYTELTSSEIVTISNSMDYYETWCFQTLQDELKKAYKKASMQHVRFRW